MEVMVVRDKDMRIKTWYEFMKRGFIEFGLNREFAYDRVLRRGLTCGNLPTPNLCKAGKLMSKQKEMIKSSDYLSLINE